MARVDVYEVKIEGDERSGKAIAGNCHKFVIRPKNPLRASAILAFFAVKIFLGALAFLAVDFFSDIKQKRRSQKLSSPSNKHTQ